jgi:CspA family cold shock protein
MPRGIIKFYSEHRGYGFISCEESAVAVDSASGNELYVHYSQFKGLRSPHEGQAVTFEVRDGERGLEAVNVHTTS